MQIRKLAGIAAILAVGAFVIAMPIYAKDKEESKTASSMKKKSPEEMQKEAFLQQVKVNIAALNLQQVTVQVLSMELQKEMNALQQTQAVFCDTFKLDVNKFRQGRYRFDEREGKFVEQEPMALPAGSPQQ